MSSAVACLPNKKRKHSQGSANSEEHVQKRKASSDSADIDGLMGSLASDDTAAIALRAFDGGSIMGSVASMDRKPLPPKKRKASFDSAFGDETKRKASFCFEDNRRRTMSIDSQAFENESAFGLIPLGSVTGTGSTGSIDEHLRANPSHDNASISSETHSRLPPLTSRALEHLDALGDDIVSLGLNKEECKTKPDGDESSEATMASSNQRILLEALMGVTGGGGSSQSFRRDRIESWGGMSDISMSGMGSENAAALAHSALYHTGLLEDLTAAADSAASSISENEMIPSKISLTMMNRKMSLGGMSECTALINPENCDVSSDIHAFVAAAMASVGDQLAGLAGAVEAAAEGSMCGSIASEMLGAETESDASSTTSTLLDIRLDEGGRPRSWSTSSRPISVDYDAVQAAVDAAESATAALDLTSIATFSTPHSGRLRSDSAKKVSRRLPLQKNRIDTFSSFPPLPPPKKSASDMEAIRARARAAAGYIPPLDDGQQSAQPIKKRAKRPDSTPTPNKVYASCETPSNKGTPHTIYTPMPVPMQTPSSIYTPATPASAFSTASKASSQKWDEMYECLVEFVQVRRELENRGASEKAKNEWEWDGNVPTTYKSKDGKALGRWINNQRSAKHKGSLKPDREVKLVDAGLKWSVLSTNSWQDMMEELRIYVAERTKDGREWDGNVPTNYRIKGPATPTPIPENDADDDKNLGRWINRQRSLYQAGKLRKDREEELENIGLRWSVLSTTSWQSMFEALLEYARERKAEDPNTEWDGNVPANYKTDERPSKALGRWVNRQRSAYMKNKLKKDFVDKLDAVGLKWAVHERRPYPPYPPTSVISTVISESKGNQCSPTAPISTNTVLAPKTLKTPMPIREVTISTTQSPSTNTTLHLIQTAPGATRANNASEKEPGAKVTAFSPVLASKLEEVCVTKATSAVASNDG